MRIYSIFVFAISAMTMLAAGSEPARHRTFTVDFDLSSYPALKTYGDPTVVDTQILYGFGGGRFIGDDHQRFERPISDEDLAADALTVYVYRRGCRVGHYQIDSVKNDSLQRTFSCEPAPDKLVTVRIQNFDILDEADLFAWVSYDGPPHVLHTNYKTADGRPTYSNINFSVGVFPIHSNGVFTLPLPDFGNDQSLLQAAASSDSTSPYREPKFRIYVSPLHGSVLGNLVAANAKLGEAVRVAPDYPSEIHLSFIAQR